MAIRWRSTGFRSPELIGCTDQRLALASTHRWPLACATLLLGALVLPVCAGNEQRVQLDPARSSVRFQIPLLLFGQVQGTFAAVSGELLHAPAGWQVCADVEVASARLSRSKDREELLGPSFFHADRHPQLRFVSDPLPPGLPREGAVLRGRLSVRGYTRSTRFVMQHVQCPDTTSIAGCEFRLHGTIRRRDFGMRARPAVLGNTVALQLQIAVCAADAQHCNTATKATSPDCAVRAQN
jgi:polyisoprenoid-binding protein YceI